MEKESCSHSEKDGKAMPQEAEQKGAESGRQGQMNMGPSGGYPNQATYSDAQYSFQQGAGQPQMNMGHPGGYPSQQPMQSSHKCSGSGHQGQMNMGPSGGYPNQPPYSDMQQNFQGQMNMGYPGEYYPNQSSHSGMKGGHSKPSHHCSCGDQQQYGPGHVSEMMGRFMSGNVTVDDMGAISSFFGIDCQSTRFWTGIALGAVGALILTKAFKS